ncbi:MAG TPA: efflux RND transporter periplasmic adaptor subunit [Bauldia sp.]|nr:efflux RND transporter periplasmic adaptor subunit [Bauldia sp.]
MAASRQIAVIVIIIVAVAVGWFGYERGWYGHTVAAGPGGQGQQTAQNAGGGAGQQGNRPQRQGGAGGGQGGGGFGGAFGRGGPVIVVTQPVETDNSGIEVQAVGTVASAKAVTLYPQVTGVVTDISFMPGSAVTQGQPLLHLDDGDEQIALDKARLAVQSAQAAYDRANQLAQSNNATAVSVTDAKNALDTAQIGLKSAQLDLDKRTVSAPFAGTVGLTDLSIGDLVNSQKSVTTLDDMTTVTVGFSVPERASGLVKIGDPVTATTDALAGQKFTGKVIAVDSRVDPTTRALNVEAVLPNDAAALKPGMALTLVLDFPGAPHPSVPSLSIQWDRQGSYVWKVVDGKAKRIAVQIITRRSGVVTVAGDLKEGDPVVTEGVLRIRDGIQVAEAGSFAGAANGGGNAGQQGNRQGGGQGRPAANGGAAGQPAAGG